MLFKRQKLTSLKNFFQQKALSKDVLPKEYVNKLILAFFFPLPMTWYPYNQTCGPEDGSVGLGVLKIAGCWKVNFPGQWFEVSYRWKSFCLHFPGPKPPYVAEDLNFWSSCPSLWSVGIRCALPHSVCVVLGNQLRTAWVPYTHYQWTPS